MQKLTEKKENLSFCLTTYYDKKFKAIGALCMKSIEEYAKKFKITVIKYEKKLSERPPAWNKILIVKELLKRYDFVIWIDADALFVRFDEDIRKEIEDGRDFYISLVDFKNRLVPNSGFFMVRKSNWSKNFLERVWNKKEYIYHNYWENAAIIDLLGYNESILSNKYKLAINKFLYKLRIKAFLTSFTNNLHITKITSKIFSESASVQTKKRETLQTDLKKVKWLDIKWNSLPGKAESKKPIVHHYPAKPFAERLNRMTEDLQHVGLLK